MNSSSVLPTFPGAHYCLSVESSNNAYWLTYTATVGKQDCQKGQENLMHDRFRSYLNDIMNVSISWLLVVIVDYCSGSVFVLPFASSRRRSQSTRHQGTGDATVPHIHARIYHTGEPRVYSYLMRRILHTRQNKQKGDRLHMHPGVKWKRVKVLDSSRFALEMMSGVLCS